ncbi:TPA: hypothetical protein ACH3X2_008186 [Trebouxia sp. C0005]
MDESDRESWSFVDEDEASGRVSPAPPSESSTVLTQGRTATSAGELSRTQSLVTSGQLNGMSGGSGNDSPSRPAMLEAVDGSSPQQAWNLSSSLSSSEVQMYQRPSSLASASEGDDSENHFSPAASQTAQVAAATSPSAADASSVVEGNTFSPEGLPPLHTAMEDRDYNDGDSMSVASAGTAVMVGHPGSDEEEDTAERRWRLAEQRGNDIRRARAPPCPKAIGPDCFLKVIVVGEAGLGKTTFVQNLQAAFQPDGPSHPSVAPSQDEGANIYELFEQSPQELCTEVTVNTETSKFHYLLQDTPGLVYGQTSVRIPDHIKAQNNAYLAWEQDPTRSAPMSASVDHRVDACLFFLNPNHLKDAEVAAMAALAEMVPVVPMIAKADIFTPSELTAFRLHVEKRITEEEEKLGRKIMWRPNKSPQGDEEPKLGEGHGRCSQPPFAVIASNNTDLAVGRFWPVRTYPWGKCEALSSSNSDLSSLKRLLFEDGFAGLKRATEARYHKFRTAHLTQPAEGQVGPVAEDVTGSEEEEVAETSAELETESDTDDVSDMSQPEDVVAGPAAIVEHGRAEKRGQRSMWMWGVVVASIVCCSLIGSNNKLQADKKALQKELSSARNLADMKDQAASQMEAYEPLAGEAHLKPHTVVQMRDSLGDGSGCTMLISAWRETLEPAAKHTRRLARLAAAQNASNDELIIVQAVADPEEPPFPSTNTSAAPVPGSEAVAQFHLLPEVVTPPETLYKPHTFGSASHAAVQTYSQAACTAGRLSSAAGAHSLVAIQYTAHHSARHALAAATAVVEFSQSVADRACRLGRSTSLALFHCADQTSASLTRRLAAAQVALQQAGHASALVLRSFGNDVAEASKVVVRSAPTVMRNIQEDMSHKLEGAQGMVKHAGHSVAQRVTHAAHHVSVVNRPLAADCIQVTTIVLVGLLRHV